MTIGVLRVMFHSFGLLAVFSTTLLINKSEGCEKTKINNDNQYGSSCDEKGHLCIDKISFFFRTEISDITGLNHYGVQNPGFLFIIPFLLHHMCI